MQDVMAKVLAWPLKILLTPWMFFLVMLPAAVFGTDDEGLNKIWNGYWTGW